MSSTYEPRPVKRVRSKKDFTCEHCGADVPRLAARVKGTFARNSCTECNWSKHVGFDGMDDLGYPPCGGMMKPYLIDDGIRITWRCLGCGWMMTGPSERGMDELVAGKRTEAINVVFYPREA